MRDDRKLGTSRSSGPGRRRALAMLGAVGLAPRAALAQEADAPEVWACGASRPTQFGMHRLEYMLKGREATAIRGVMRFDLDDNEWLLEHEDTREISLDAESNFFALIYAEAERRRAALHRIPDGAERDIVSSSIDNMYLAAAWNGGGLMDLALRTPPGRADTLVPEKMILRFPPMGKLAGVDNDFLGITAQTATGDRISEWAYKVTDADSSLSGAGPEPVIVEDDRAKLQTLADRMVAGERVAFRVTDEDQQTLYQLVLPMGYDWATEYAAMTGLLPVAQQAARAKVQGNYDAYRADNPQGGTCEKRDCFLTTATAGAVGLPDDCWELSTLRAFRDGWLARHPGGAALTAHYYRLAPMMVHRIERRADARAVWLRAWAFGVLPAALAARLGLNRLALRAYRRLVRSLARKAPAAHPAKVLEDPPWPYPTLEGRDPT
ncbi:CFI-box-CTERM domain-containing protein [Roseovarius ramblicola]|uniref:CFI-box-CTERM domain-containing protein n=1 Tax=Roseovarius ramblicola TaxID=2022336 RepID=A0ABV5I3L5_9RHOB